MDAREYLQEILNPREESMVNKFKIELFLKTGEATSYITESTLSLDEIDINIARSLANDQFITAEESDTTIYSVRCSLVDKYRVTQI